LSYFDKEILVLGCGNILFGDDGFGPEVIEYLEQNFTLPDSVYAVNAGLSVRSILFNVVLSEAKPRKIIIVDAVDTGNKPGELLSLEVDQIPAVKCDDFSLHQIPTSNLLKELNDLCGVEVKIIAVQIQHIPDEIEPGLSALIKGSIPRACEMIMAEVNLPK
jgi:coenzyme F420 hydrogenase subunit delta